MRFFFTLLLELFNTEQSTHNPARADLGGLLTISSYPTYPLFLPRALEILDRQTTSDGPAL